MTISYPRPLFSNPTIRPLDYEPSNFEITAITRGTTTTVETTTAHDFVVGQNVRILVPVDYGMRQINGLRGYISQVPTTTTCVVEINSNNFDAFVNANSGTPAQIKAIGDINNGVISSTGPNVPSTAIPGSFINVSP